MGNLPRANKELGQHFLTDKNIIQNITDDFAGLYDVIVEVGPGPGVLTKNLSQKNKPLFVIEMDERFPELLIEFVQEDHIFRQDALEFHWEKFIKDNNFEDKKIWLVSNLPYNVSTPLTLNFLKIPQIKYMTLMYQKEVALKFYLTPHMKNEMNSLHALAANFFSISHLCKVLPGAFSPPPRVDSAVISYTRLENTTIPATEFNQYEKFLRLMFSQRRKQLVTVLKQRYEKTIIEKLFGELNLSPMLRSEALTLKNVFDLYQKFRDVV